MDNRICERLAQNFLRYLKLVNATCSPHNRNSPEILHNCVISIIDNLTNGPFANCTIQKTRCRCWVRLMHARMNGNVYD